MCLPLFAIIIECYRQRTGERLSESKEENREAWLEEDRPKNISLRKTPKSEMRWR
jgi:hypothetical protein